MLVPNSRDQQERLWLLNSLENNLTIPSLKLNLRLEDLSYDHYSAIPSSISESHLEVEFGGIFKLYN